MGFIHPDVMIPLNWRYYSTYRVTTLNEYLEELDSEQAEDNRQELRRLYVTDHPMMTEEDWSSILAMEIIFPPASATCRFYNAWGDAEKPESFQDFSTLWRFGAAPSSEQLIGWACIYGLPCETAHTDSLKSIWGFNARYTSLLKDIAVAKCLMPITNMATRTDPDAFYRARHTMFKSVLVELAREAHDVSALFDALINGKLPPPMDPRMKKMIEEGPALQLDKLNPKARPVKFPKMWKSLQERISARIMGLQISMKSKHVENFPSVELRHTFSAQDLLTVMWVRFYDQMLALSPTDKCAGCGTIFKKTRANQTFCSESCKHRINKQKSRARLKQTEAGDPADSSNESTTD